MLRHIFISSFALLLLPFAIACSSPLSIATFNIEYYGLAGNSTGTFKDEYRNPFLEEFMKDQIGEAQVIVFQEIVDVPALGSLMAKFNMTCRTYEKQATELHQYVVLCHKQEFRFESLREDGLYAMEEVKAGNTHVRPGLWGMLQDREGHPILQIVSVHLKAHKDGTALRLEQIKALSHKLEKDRVAYPTIVIGDFNAHNNDKDEFAKIFALNTSKLKLASYPQANSYRTYEISGAYDQAFISDYLNFKAEVKGPCNLENQSGKRFLNLDFYNRTISDHCPVLYQIDL